jgi:hypothetical protein
MRKTMAELSAEFNGTAEGYRRGEVEIGLLLTKYDVIQRYGGGTKEETRALAVMLYEHSLAWLRSLADDNGPKPDYYAPGKADLLLSKLTEPRNINFLPATAPEALAEAALDLMRRMERPKALVGDNRTYTQKVVDGTLGAADKIREAQAQMPEEPAPVRKKDEALAL